MSKPTDLVQGTLDLLLLKMLALEPLNGFAVSQRLKQVSGDVLQVSDGSLSPVVELTGPHAQPVDESSGTNLGLFRPAPDEIHHQVPHIMRHPHLGQSSPTFFLKAMCEVSHPRHQKRWRDNPDLLAFLKKL
jgi:hypothetical protein